MRRDPARGATPDVSDEFERERARAEAAAADASRAERELLGAQARVRELEAKLQRTERRLDAIRRRPYVRVADSVHARVRAGMGALASAVGRGRGRRDRVADRPSVARSFEGVATGDLPARYRETLLDALHRGAGTTARFAVAPFGPMPVLLEGLAERGIVASRDEGADAILVTHPGIIPTRLPEGPIRIGIHPAISEDFDILVGESDDPAGAVVDAIDHWVRATRVGIRIPAPHPGLAETWGDTHFARAFRNALRRAGWPARIRLRHVWDRPFVATDDVVVDLLGLHETTSQLGGVRVLWQISHPELARPELYDRYDVAFVASDTFAERMAALTHIPVHALHQATDPQRFQPREGGPPHELLFVGGWRQAGRRILEDLMPTDHELAVYGGRWTPERIDPRHLAGDAIPNAELPAYYGAASIVLNDHWAAMRRQGFLSNRLYDAAASGAFVISDAVEGLDREFDGGIVGYRDPSHLRNLIEHFLANPEERREYAQRAQHAVLERHTFNHRARAFIEAVEPLLPGRSPR
jgi:hypothetical protein